MIRQTVGWILLAVFAAMFVNDPRATTQFAWDSFNALGEFGGSLMAEVHTPEEGFNQ